MTIDEIAALVQRNCDRSGAPTAEDTDAFRWVNQAIREVICRRHNWPTMRTISSTVPTVADDESYAFPTANTKDVDMVLLKGAGASDDYVPLEEISNPLAHANFGELTDTAQPTAWFRFGSNVYLRPIPDAVYTLKYITWEYPATLTTGQSNDFTNNFTHLVETVATAFGQARYLDLEQATAQRTLAEAELAEEIRLMKVQEAPARPTARISRAAGMFAPVGRRFLLRKRNDWA